MFVFCLLCLFFLLPIFDELTNNDIQWSVNSSKPTTRTGSGVSNEVKLTWLCDLDPVMNELNDSWRSTSWYARTRYNCDISLDDFHVDETWINVIKLTNDWTTHNNVHIPFACSLYSFINSFVGWWELRHIISCHITSTLYVATCRFVRPTTLT